MYFYWLHEYPESNWANALRRSLLHYEVTQSLDDVNEWRVVAIDCEQVFMAIFLGPGAEWRAKEYVEWKNAAYKPMSTHT